MLALVGMCMNTLGCLAPQLQVGGLDGNTWTSGKGSSVQVGPSLESFPSQRSADRKHKELPAVEVPPPPLKGSTAVAQASSLPDSEAPAVKTSTTPGLELPPPPPRGQGISLSSTSNYSDPNAPPVIRPSGSIARQVGASHVERAVHLSEPEAPAPLPQGLAKGAASVPPKPAPLTSTQGEGRFAAAWEPTAPPPRVQEGTHTPESLPEALPPGAEVGCGDCAGGVAGGDHMHPRYHDGKHPWAKGCFKCALPHLSRDIPVREVPKEGALVNTPPYVIETPDILLIESARSLPDQPIEGEHLVRMDGTISLGVYGAVRVAGLTIDEARDVVQRHLARYIRDPQVNLDVYAYNSKFYYIITDGGGYGWQVTRVNFTGNETVLDAVSLLGGLPAVSSKRLWIARPDPADPKNSLILPIDWLAIVQCGQAATNYQLFPGDRLFVQSDRLIKLDSTLAKIITPAERILGVALLTGLTISRYQNLGRFINVFGNGVLVP